MLFLKEGLFDFACQCFFLYNKAAQKNIREQVFTNYSVKKIYDFTHLRRDLFHRAADTPAIAISK